MLKLILILCTIVTSPLLAKSSKSIPEVKSLFRSLLPTASSDQKRKDSFKVHGCKDYQPQWMAYFLFQQNFTANYKFSKKCDIDGSVNIKASGPFPLKLKLKNLGKLNKVEMLTTIKANMQTKTVSLKGAKGKIHGKKPHFFQGNLDVVIDVIDGKLVKKSEKGVIKFFKDDSYKEVIAQEQIGS